MEKIRGKIEKVSVEEGMTNDRAWKRWQYIINGKKYSTFDDEIGNNFKPNDYVEMTGAQKGQYWNMETMNKVSETQEQADKVAEEANKINPNGFDGSKVMVGILKDMLAELKQINERANGNA